MNHVMRKALSFDPYDRDGPKPVRPPPPPPLPPRVKRAASSNAAPRRRGTARYSKPEADTRNVPLSPRAAPKRPDARPHPATLADLPPPPPAAAEAAATSSADVDPSPPPDWPPEKPWVPPRLGGRANEPAAAASDTGAPAASAPTRGGEVPLSWSTSRPATTDESRAPSPTARVHHSSASMTPTSEVDAAYRRKLAASPSLRDAHDAASGAVSPPMVRGEAADDGTRPLASRRPPIRPSTAHALGAKETGAPGERQADVALRPGSAVVERKKSAGHVADASGLTPAPPPAVSAPPAEPTAGGDEEGDRPTRVSLDPAEVEVTPWQDGDDETGAEAALHMRRLAGEEQGAASASIAARPGSGRARTTTSRRPGSARPGSGRPKR